MTNDSEFATLKRDDNTNQEVNSPEGTLWTFICILFTLRRLLIVIIGYICILAEKGVPNFWRYALVNHELLHAEVRSWCLHNVTGLMFMWKSLIP